jgi:hypothetical protein
VTCHDSNDCGFHKTSKSKSCFVSEAAVTCSLLAFESNAESCEAASMQALTPNQLGVKPVPDKVVEGVSVFVHRYQPTDQDRANWEAWWREFLGRHLNEGDVPRTSRD